MFHVSLRYIFGIPPLILVLLPVASPDCEIEGKNGEEYRHVLTVSFEILNQTKMNRRRIEKKQQSVTRNK
uniref:Interleukin-7 n=1 Tax=Rhinolophus ferrumequinum TaxID=59479 RepID=A0A671EDA3_RHIFE